MSGWTAFWRYEAARASFAWSLYSRAVASKAPGEALGLALKHFWGGRLTFIFTEPRHALPLQGEPQRHWGEAQSVQGDTQPPQGGSQPLQGGASQLQQNNPQALLHEPAADNSGAAHSSTVHGNSSTQKRHAATTGERFLNFPRRILVRRLLDPGPKAVFVGDLVLLELEADSVPSAATWLPKATQRVSVNTCFQSLLPSSTMGGAADHLQQQQQQQQVFAPSHQKTHGAAVSPAPPSPIGPWPPAHIALSTPNPSPAVLSFTTIPPNSPSTDDPSPPSPAPTSPSAVLRRVAAVEGMVMVSSDPDDMPFRIPKGHCWLLQPSDDSTFTNTAGAGWPVDEWDSRSTGPVPCSQILGRALYVAHSPLQHEEVLNSPQAKALDGPVLAMEFDHEALIRGT